MKNFYWIFLLFTFYANAQSKLSIDKIMQDPKWIGTSPSNIYWSPDNKEINFSWNPDKQLFDSMYTYDLAEKNIKKLGKKLESSLIPSSARTNKDNSMLVWSKNGDLFIHYINTKKTVQLTQTVDSEMNPIFSADEQFIIFRKTNDIFTLKIENGMLSQLSNFDRGSKKPEPKKTDEEIWLEKDQETLFKVTAERKLKEKLQKESLPKELKKIYLDDKRQLGLEIDPSLNFMFYSTSETPKNSKNTIVPNYLAAAGYTEDLSARSKVGSPQATIDSYITDLKRDTTFKINFSKLPGLNVEPLYLAEYLKNDTVKRKYTKTVSISNIKFSENGGRLIASARSDDNKDRWIIEIDTKTGIAKSLDHQHDEAWIGGPGIGFGGTLGFIDENTIYFQSEETGYSHLYAFDLKNNTKKALTAGKFEILKAEISANKSKFFITANKEHPGEQHFYHLDLATLNLTKITTAKGAHDVSVSPDEQQLAIRFSYSNKPWELYLQKNEAGAESIKITSSLTPEFLSYNWKDPKIISFKASDNQEIFGRIYEPLKKNKKAVIFVHGAGYLQNAHFWWSNYFREYMFHNLLTDLGYTVLDIDYRASAGYGRDVRTGIYRHMGGKDLGDHVDAAKLLTEKYGIDKSKIGIYGGSYGGFITLMGLFTAPDVFKAGAALRPVTDWAAYNHGYTANILNTPQKDSLAYKKSSPIYFANGLKNNLLICHGVVDVNVHYQDVVRLSQKLIELKKTNWELASYPVEDHGFVEPSSWADEYRRILLLFEEKLK